MKICNRCKQLKSLNDFCKRNKSKDKLSFWCKKCRITYLQKYRSQNKDAIKSRYEKCGREYSKKYYKDHKDKIINYATKRRKEKTICTVINGKVTTLTLKYKRPKPEDGLCEMCKKKITRLSYHHWVYKKEIIGIWVCNHCHIFINKIEKGVHKKYLDLKRIISQKVYNLLMDDENKSEEV